MINKVVIHFVILFALMIPVSFTEAGLLRNVLQSCAFGGGAMAAVTYVSLAPEFKTGVLAMPVSEVIVTNAIIGCGVGVAGATAATVIGWFYDVIF